VFLYMCLCVFVCLQAGRTTRWANSAQCARAHCVDQGGRPPPQSGSTMLSFTHTHTCTSTHTAKNTLALAQIAYTTPWIIMLSQLAYYSKVFGPQVRACVRACVRARVCVCACARACLCRARWCKPTAAWCMRAHTWRPTRTKHTPDASRCAARRCCCSSTSPTTCPASPRCCWWGTSRRLWTPSLGTRAAWPSGCWRVRCPSCAVPPACGRSAHSKHCPQRSMSTHRAAHSIAPRALAHLGLQTQHKAPPHA
jgi:hypothetical protein